MKKKMDLSKGQTTVHLDSKDRMSWTLTLKFDEPVDETTVAGAIGMFAEKIISDHMKAKVEEEIAFYNYLKAEGLYDDYLAKFKSSRVQTLQG